MSVKYQIPRFTLHDVLNSLNEKEQHTGGIHVHFDRKLFTASPFPYPFRVDNNAVVLLLRGKIKVRIEFETYQAVPGDVIFLPSDSLIHLSGFEGQVQCISVVFTNDFVLKNLLNHRDINILRMLSDQKIYVLALNRQKLRIFKQLVENLYYLNTRKTEPYRDERIFSYFNALILEYIALYQEKIKDIDLKTVGKKDLIQRFLNELYLHFRKERNVYFYADKINVTPDYLTKVLKEATGMTTFEIIEEVVVMEARNLLMNNSLTISQISEELHFSNQSFFGKFFKRKMKVSPKTFRNKTIK